MGMIIMTSDTINENFISDGVVDNGEKSSKMNFWQKLVKSRGWFNTVLFISILNLCYNLYQLNNNFFDDDNLFENGSLVADSGDVLGLTSLMEEEMEVTIPEEFVDDYLVLNGVRENRHLNEEEKEFFYKYIDLIKDNPYLNKEVAYSSLLNLNIVSMNRPSDVSDSVVADYTYFDRTIRLFHDDLEKKSLAHEGIHCLFISESTSNLPLYFKEGMTELLTNEYFSDTPYIEDTSYPFEICAVKMLCELTSADTVLRAFSYGDMSYISKEIGIIIGNEEDALLALDALDYLFKVFRDEYDGCTNPIVDSYLGNYICDVFNKCIEMKYFDGDAYKREDYLFHYNLFTYMFNDKPYTTYFDVCDSLYLEKPYFSSRLKSQYFGDVAVENDKKILEKTVNGG